MKSHSGVITSVNFSPDGSRIVTGSADKIAMIWDAKIGTKIGKSLEGQSNAVNSVNFSPDCTKIVSGGIDNLAMI